MLRCVCLKALCSISHSLLVQAFGSFPCELSVLDIEAELDWDPAVGNINQAPVSLYDDGGVLYFK